MNLIKQFTHSLLPVFLFLGLAGHTQVGIGTTTPNRSAILDVSGDDGGLLPPRMTQDEMNNILVSPDAEGLLIYCTDCSPKGMYYYDGSYFLNSITEIPSGAVSVTGRIWMDRNLGAAQVASSSTDALSFGDLYQWGRGSDGHQLRSSGTTNALSGSDVPGHGDFILESDTLGDGDWRSPQNHDLWDGVSGINNPCPSGYRLPTDREWEAETINWNSRDASGAFMSSLKLPLAGLRLHDTGAVEEESFAGYYWSSTVASINYASVLVLGPGSAENNTVPRGEGYSVRCIKDY